MNLKCGPLFEGEGGHGDQPQQGDPGDEQGPGEVLMLRAMSLASAV